MTDKYLRKKYRILPLAVSLLIMIAALCLAPFTKEASADEKYVLSGKVNNLVVLVETLGDEGYFTEQKTEDIAEIYGNGDNGVGRYFNLISGGKLNLATTLAQYVDKSTYETKTVVVNDSFSAGYYMPFCADNLDGYFEYCYENSLGEDVYVYDCNGCNEHILESAEEGLQYDVQCMGEVSDTSKLRQSFDRLYREHSLVKRATEQAKKQMTLDDTADYDLNDDGFFDCLTIYINGTGSDGQADGGDVFWPHKWNLRNTIRYSGSTILVDDKNVLDSYPDYADADLYSYFDTFFGSDSDTAESEFLKKCKIGDLYVSSYMLLADSSIKNTIVLPFLPRVRSSIICHELIHLLDTLGKVDESKVSRSIIPFGVTDLYHYAAEDADRVPVGKYDIMGITAFTQQNLNSYYRSKFGWTEITPITSNGTYRVYPMLSEEGVTSYSFGAKDGQLFVLEMRSNVAESKLDLEIGGTGLLVYRVNTAFSKETAANRSNSKVNGGNIDSGEEIFVFRSGSDLAQENFDALLGVGQGYGNIDPDSTEGAYTYISGGTEVNSRITISGIKRLSDGSMEFRILVDPALYTVRGSVDSSVGEYSIYVNDEPRGSFTGNFVLTGIAPADSIQIKARGYIIDKIIYDERGAEDYVSDLGEITAIPETASTLTITVRNKQGELYDGDGQDFSVTLGGDIYSLVEYKGEGVFEISGLFAGDELELSLDGYTLSDGSYTYGESTLLELTYYSRYTVSGIITHSDGEKVIDNTIYVYIDGERTDVVVENGEFTLTDVAHGSKITFSSRSYNFTELTVTDDVADAVIIAERKNGAIRLPTVVPIVMVIVAALIVVTYLTLDSKKDKSHVRKKRK